jgi:apolipoprotein D and lipocalin family protein
MKASRAADRTTTMRFGKTAPIPVYSMNRACARKVRRRTVGRRQASGLRQWPAYILECAMKGFFLLCALLLGGCVHAPEGVAPVSGFQLERYLGKWYEIARLDHSFERGLTQVTAEYSLRDDGSVRVLNRGFAADKNAWDQAEGRARFVENSDTGFLKVSFFGPFYGSYVVFELDREGYQYAVVAGPDKSYLWILARTPVIDRALQERLVARAAAAGFDTGKLIFVDQRAAGVRPAGG